MCYDCFYFLPSYVQCLRARHSYSFASGVAVIQETGGVEGEDRVVYTIIRLSESSAVKDAFDFKSFAEGMCPNLQNCSLKQAA